MMRLEGMFEESVAHRRRWAAVQDRTDFNDDKHHRVEFPRRAEAGPRNRGSALQSGQTNVSSWMAAARDNQQGASIKIGEPCYPHAPRNAEGKTVNDNGMRKMASKWRRERDRNNNEERDMIVKPKKGELHTHMQEYGFYISCSEKRQLMHP